MAGSNGCEGAVEVAFDGADGEVGGLGDLCEAHLIDETEDEDAALTGGETGDGLPDEGHLLAGDETGFDGAGGLGVR